MTDPVLLVDDDIEVREALAQTLELADLRPIAVGSFVAAKDHITRDFPGVILSDIRMPGRDGFHLLAHAREVDEDLPVILLTGEGDIPMALRAVEQGAFGFLEKPCSPSDLVAELRKALERRRAVMQDRAERVRREAGDPAARLIFGVSELAQDLRARVRELARLGTDVLVIGPPGSGTPKVAEVVHLCAPAAQGPFEKHAAQGLGRAALAQALEAAVGGSLFLDEIARLPADTQLALVAALEEKGAPRLIAGSTVPLDEDTIHPDLFYRLQVGTVRIPSLAERPEDIPVLFRHYVEQAAEQAGIAPPEVTPEHTAALMAQDWPGNARSLMSAAMRFVLGMPDEVTQAADLGLAEQMARVERSLLIAALGRHNGRASAAAQALKLPRKTFYDKLARHGIRPENYRR
ncbi:sigma-54-dependent transcriptional regulator [Jhaorihella thermophila]|uniref:Two-component system, NtrC family, C4-dicarboxylate transport response regulator DctD n=1 Tax=Jhaorihella thermophila TaxID=488547 RepID=A0A1H5RU12_9RHOB|nr:sigma-54 dependent transcriptional regulator [Jhaorihella thermophila]SEF41816.1 two-component system, NtrC family, C4-dicarboxylate transport response regulator DctD [Jhaorihella thermophila]